MFFLDRLPSPIEPGSVIDDSGSATEPKTERAEEPATRKGMSVTQRPNEKSQTRHITPPNRTKSSEVDWERLAADYPDGEKSVAGAIERLKNGDVSSTKYGIRVRVREDLGEYGREGGAAFWPKEKYREAWVGACGERSGLGWCSHIVAAQMYQEWLKECADAAKQARAETDSKVVRPVEDWFKKPHAKVR